MSPSPVSRRVVVLPHCSRTFERLDTERFVVTHLPNVRYLTGFIGTAGAAIVRESSARSWSTSATRLRHASLVAASSDKPFDIRVVQGTYDDAISQALLFGRRRKVGIEARVDDGGAIQSARSDALQGAGGVASANADRSFRPSGWSSAPRGQRRGGDRHPPGGSAPTVPRSHESSRIGRARAAPEARIAADIDTAIRAAGFERPAFETIVASGRTAPSARAAGHRRLEAGMGWCWTSGASTTDTAWI